MHRSPTGPHCQSRVGLIRGLALGLAVTLGSGLSAEAQTPAKRAAAAPDARPLARYVPLDGLFLYMGSEGLDLQTDAWKKTAAYKVLNETNLGVVLEAMLSQSAEKALAVNPEHRLSGSDVVAIVEQMARGGFVVAVCTAKGATPDAPPAEHAVIVIRGGASKAARGSFSRLLGTLWGANKPQQVKKGSRPVIVVPMSAKPKGDSWTWWSEGNDLVITVGKGADDAVIAALDRKKPSALEHPSRAELARPEGGFTPVGQFFLDITAMPGVRRRGVLGLAGGTSRRVGGRDGA